MYTQNRVKMADDSNHINAKTCYKANQHTSYERLFDYYDKQL